MPTVDAEHRDAELVELRQHRVAPSGGRDAERAEHRTERAGQQPGTFTPWRDLPANTDLLFYDPSSGTGEFYTTDGTIIRPDPWQNAATVALQYYFSVLYSGDAYKRSISSVGFALAYQNLFGDPWSADQTSS